MSTIVLSQPRSSRPFIHRSAPREELKVHRSPDTRRRVVKISMLRDEQTFLPRT